MPIIVGHIPNTANVGQIERKQWSKGNCSTLDRERKPHWHDPSVGISIDRFLEAESVAFFDSTLFPTYNLRCLSWQIWFWRV